MKTGSPLRRQVMAALDANAIQALEQLYPDQCPSLSLSEREVWFKAGQADVVRTLKRLHAEAQRTPPTVL